MNLQLQHVEIRCSAHNKFMCFVWISEQTAIISLYQIYWLVFINEMKSVYRAVRTGSLNQTNSSALQGLKEGAAVRIKLQ